MNYNEMIDVMDKQGLEILSYGDLEYGKEYLYKFHKLKMEICSSWFKSKDDEIKYYTHVKTENTLSEIEFTEYNCIVKEWIKLLDEDAHVSKYIVLAIKHFLLQVDDDLDELDNVELEKSKDEIELIDAIKEYRENAELPPISEYDYSEIIDEYCLHKNIQISDYKEFGHYFIEVHKCDDDIYNLFKLGAIDIEIAGKYYYANNNRFQFTSKGLLEIY